METILSVGIDVGTSTTQVVFSRLVMDNAGGFFSVPKVSIVDKQVIYKSDVHLTPLESEVWINTDRLREIVAHEYERAGFTPADVDSGAVIITGESARKENSDAVLKSLSDFAGDFVVSAAGPDMESVIAGKGSGAWQYSMDNHCRTANLDIGGGTTNIAVFDDGKVIGRGCFDIGGRLICVSKDMLVTKVSDAAKSVAASLGIELRAGSRTDLAALRMITERMARILETAFMQGAGTDIYEHLCRTLKTPGSSDLSGMENIKAVFFSGGVADMIYHDHQDPIAYGDIGVLLGRAVKSSSLCSEYNMPSPGETIRATVVGAGTYTTSISGSTITYSDGLLPLKNIPVIRLDEHLQDEIFEGRPAAVIDHIRWQQEQSRISLFMLAMPGKKDPGWQEMKRAATTIYEVMRTVLPVGAPILIVIECDIAKAMGMLIKNLPGSSGDIICIDSIHVMDGEYIDMGRPVMNGMVIPVVVKTLIFG